MSTPTRRRRKGLRILDLMVLVAAVALAISACTASWTRSFDWLSCMMHSPSGTTRLVSTRVLLSDEVLSETSRLLRERSVSLATDVALTPQQLRCVLTLGWSSPGEYQIRARTHDPAVDRIVLDAWQAAMEAWLKRHPEGLRGREPFAYSVVEIGSFPEPFGQDTPWVVAGMLCTSGLAVLWVLFRACSFHKDVAESTVEPGAGAG